MKEKKRTYTRIALAVSVVIMILWGMMGTGASLAWFTDTDEEVKNIFHFAEFDLDVEYRTENGSWKSIEADTEVFDDKALYEPGYTQVVYLRIINNGTVPFDFKTAVSVSDYTVPTNVFGQKFHLQDYLKFGFVTADTEAEMDELVKTRQQAAECATNQLSNYSTEMAELDAKETIYMALVVRMPEEVDNVANYRGDVIPRVELGIIVTATQKEMPKE